MNWNDWTDTPGDLVAVLTVVGIALSALLWLVRAEIRRNGYDIRANGEQLAPNHGTSLRDAVDRLEESLKMMHSDMAEGQRYARHDVEALGLANTAEHAAINTAVVRLNDRINSHLDDHLKTARKPEAP